MKVQLQMQIVAGPGCQFEALARGKGICKCVCVCDKLIYVCIRPAAGETWARLVEKHIIISTQIRLDNASYSLIDGCLIASRRRGAERGKERRV